MPIPLQSRTIAGMQATTVAEQSISVGTQLCLWLTVILWVSALIGIRIGLHGYSPGPLGLLRYLVASLCLLILYFKIPKRTLPPLRDLVHITFIGIAGIGIYNIAINYGELVVPAGIAGFVIGMMPVFSMICAIILLKESVPIKSWLGVIVSLLGLLLIASANRSGAAFNLGLLYILIAAMLGGYYAVAQKTLFHRYHPLELVILSIWGGTLPMLIYFPALIHEIPQASWQATTAAVYLGIFPAAVAYALWNYALARAPASRASGYLYGMPIITALLGMLILDEYPKVIELFGGLITLGGSLIINYFYKRR